MRWLEAALPLGIIAGMLCIMGNAQYYIHKAYHGRPKHIGNDVWDVAMERRDKKLVEQSHRRSSSTEFRYRRVSVGASTSMEAPGGNSDVHRGSSSNPNSRRYRVHLSASNFIRAPISALLEYSGLLRPRSSHQDSESLIARSHRILDSSPPNNGSDVSIRIISPREQEQERLRTAGPPSTQPVQHVDASCTEEVSLPPVVTGSGSLGALDSVDASRSERGTGDGISQSSEVGVDSEAVNGVVNNRDSNYQRYAIQQAARWIEQLLPFSLLLLVVFVRQHLQGFFATIWISLVMVKSNDILRKQTALKGERKIFVLIGICNIFTLHVFGVYWWFRNDDVLYPLIMLPPFIQKLYFPILCYVLNSQYTLVRQAAMIIKCILLIYYKNSIVDRIEIICETVCHCRFLPQQGIVLKSLFWCSPSLTGLYLTFKLTSVIEKAQSFIAAVKALSHKEVHYGASATSEQLNAAGDMCAICQEKMHTPISLSCKHIFCEDCVSEWFERERTCPLYSEAFRIEPEVLQDFDVAICGRRFGNALIDVLLDAAAMQHRT
ncbi:hypothetical protein Nepgr_031928 [Nepenthes gracilis]|uniref:RING-type domain-containing protein n=1 Tax=Nepenthes gracilis TaxID=150966 RepID=A0AAD3TID7_NEPGR|nr:hypothetical protein Nepgr_031928 [Nepenthes gracilis]